MLRYTLLRLLRLCFHHRITLNQLAQAARAWQRPQNALPGVENADATARAWLTQAVPLPLPLTLSCKLRTRPSNMLPPLQQEKRSGTRDESEA